EIANEFAEIANEFAEIANAIAEIANAIAEIANAITEITNAIAEITNIAVLNCVKYRPNPQPLPFAQRLVGTASRREREGRGVSLKGERSKCIASKQEAL
ncbi:MAG: hypothetical protein HWQ43_00640, partial [Nostoc sp. JL31]|uniref:hypothetical protein n=1 Tax=Nostoc sp. JL31 TaxID=2815395 RepID=UPI0025E3CE9B